MSDVFSNLASNVTSGVGAVSGAASAAAADFMGDMARPNNTVTVTAKKDTTGVINQNERLFSARARYGKEGLLTDYENNTDLGGNRGQWAYIKLLTTDTQAKEYRSGSTARNISPWAKDKLLGESGIATLMSDPTNIDATKGGYDRFLLTSVATQMSEKVQITEVFGDNEVVYYFGREPMIFNFSGILIDSPDNSWFTDWMMMYSEFLRGTQLAKNSELLRIVLPNMKITGTISSFSYSQESSRDVDIPFNFQFIAKLIEPLPVTSSGMITSNKLAYVDFSKVAAFTKQSDINSLKGQVNSLTGVLMNPLATLGDKSTALQKLGTGVGGLYGSALEGAKGTLAGSFGGILGQADQARASFFDGIKTSGIFQSVTSGLLGVRMSLFSPIYGIMSSLSKLVVNTFNSTVGLLNSVVNPVRNLLRDITNISNQAVALVGLVNSAIGGVGRAITGQIAGLSTDFNTAILSLGKAAGAIATAPATVAQSIAGMFSSSQITGGAVFLKVTPKLAFSRPATLSLGGPVEPASKASLLAGIVPYNPTTPIL